MEDVKAILTFILNKTYFYFMHESSHLPSQQSQGCGLCCCSPIKVGDWSFFPGQGGGGEAFFFFSGFGICIYMWGPASMEPASQPAFFSPGFVFGTFLPFLFPPWCEFVCGWFSWAQGPAEFQLCLLFVLT